MPRASVSQPFCAKAGLYRRFCGMPGREKHRKKRAPRAESSAPELDKCGAAGRDRTADPLITNLIQPPYVAVFRWAPPSEIVRYKRWNANEFATEKMVRDRMINIQDDIQIIGLFRAH